MTMRIAVIGAGAAGLVTAKVLFRAGHEVEVFDRTPDVGGVWSRTRRYPGLTTQSPKGQYSFSDHPYPRDCPEWPTGAQVQEYFAGYATASGLDPLLRLNTEVVALRPAAEGRWTVRTRDAAGEHAETEYDRVVVANGIFCEPAVPDYPGLEEFTAAGGRLCAGTEFHDTLEARGRQVLVVGYGKSACDLAVAVSGTAAGTHVIARRLLWKIPRRIAGVLNFKMLMLTRLGEALFRYVRLRGFERFLHGPGDGLRRALLNSLGSVSMRQFRLRQLKLVPSGRMEHIITTAVGLATEGFFENVTDGSITVHPDTTITRLAAGPTGPLAHLADGTVLPADLIVCATGFRQDLPFLDKDTRQGLTDTHGNFMLYRQIRPLDAPGLYFNGYNSSFMSPLNAEIAALWIAADLAGAVPLPEPAEMRRTVVDQLAFMDTATNRHHCRGAKIIPFSMHNVDEMLEDLDAQIPARIRATHWIKPVDPSAYRSVTPTLLARLTTPPTTEPQPDTAA
ncbi:cation diffusion facilitator CzcD-associated flavoprotein CzcO [Streptomyces sp. V3I8]|uniref:flavin-containing monooxygenase n=1 Tax=Streptomyces sp. V3I8 TaxID=3042279 RepID=UPI0027854CA0|nr:NAD(P)/FAD-dependent oxidoreductase [Streptomyces sp. V3I8]MDQ1035398.1 cation diffusion facilitator CzcD-associated flavoprotein CzcO [Streptomyces sp. V3I8]